MDDLTYLMRKYSDITDVELIAHRSSEEVDVWLIVVELPDFGPGLPELVAAMLVQETNALEVTYEGETGWFFVKRRVGIQRRLT